MKEDIDKVMKLYSSDVFEQFLEEAKCAECGKPATNRCSRCKNQWYCSRDCQLRQWKGHKAMCDLFFKNREEDSKRAEEAKQMRKEKEQEKVGETKKPAGKKPLIEDITKE